MTQPLGKRPFCGFQAVKKRSEPSGPRVLGEPSPEAAPAPWW